jgi:GT2 family glycosyltransferase
VIEMTTPSISFGIVALRRIPELDALVDTLLALETPDSEIVVAIETPDCDAPFEQADAHGVRWIQIPEKRGLGFNRNRLLEAVRGELLVGLDDDVEPQPGWLEALLRPLDDPGTCAASGAIIIPPSGLLGDCISALGFPAGGSVGYPIMFPVSPDGSTDNITTVNWAARIAEVRAAGGFNETLTAGGEDTELAYRLNKSGHRIVFAPDAVVVHPARSGMGDFMRWFYRRGRAKRQFVLVVPSSRFVRQRLRSYWLILSANAKSPRVLLIAALMALSLVMQWIGFMAEWLSPTSTPEPVSVPTSAG